MEREISILFKEDLLLIFAVPGSMLGYSLHNKGKSILPYPIGA
jgi:hypothetical protein